MQTFSQGQSNGILCNSSWGRWTNQLGLWTKVRAYALVSMRGVITPVCIPAVLTSAWNLFTDFDNDSFTSSKGFHIIYPSQFHEPDSEEMAPLYPNGKP